MQPTKSPSVSLRGGGTCFSQPSERRQHPHHCCLHKHRSTHHQRTHNRRPKNGDLDESTERSTRPVRRQYSNSRDLAGAPSQIGVDSNSDPVREVGEECVSKPPPTSDGMHPNEPSHDKPIESQLREERNKYNETRSSEAEIRWPDMGEEEYPEPDQGLSTGAANGIPEGNEGRSHVVVWWSPSRIDDSDVDSGLESRSYREETVNGHQHLRRNHSHQHRH